LVDMGGRDTESVPHRRKRRTGGGGDQPTGVTESPVWDELKAVLRLLQQDDPCPLQGYPDPRVDRDRTPPFSIHLRAWAVDVAEHLHRDFGDAVQLTVGTLGYPEGRPPPADWREAAQAPDIGVSLPEPIVVVSGHTVTGTIRVSNHEDSEVVVNTTAQLVGRVLDPGTREVVGMFSGALRLPLARFPIAPGADVDIPVLVGTASVKRELGYSVPPGEWLLDTVLELADGRRVRSSPLPLTVTT
jgi:hypothetical protein